MGFEIENGVLVWYKEEEGVTEVTIPAGVVEIGENAFEGASLEIVNISSGVTAIGEGAFSGCSNLVVTVPKSVFDRVGEGAFDGCKIVIT